MGRSEKKNYHHGDLRNQLMETAIIHLRKSGIEKLSLRAMARQLGVSQTAPYRHFRDKNALLAALATDGFEMLKEETRTAVEACTDNAAAGLQACGITYIRFARKNPEKYRLMFGPGIIASHRYAQLTESGAASYQVLLNAVAKCRDQGLFQGKSEQMLANTAWALVHGISMLIIDRLQCMMSEDEIEKQIQFSTQLLIEGA